MRFLFYTEANREEALTLSSLEIPYIRNWAPQEKRCPRLLSAHTADDKASAATSKSEAATLLKIGPLKDFISGRKKKDHLSDEASLFDNHEKVALR